MTVDWSGKCNSGMWCVARGLVVSVKAILLVWSNNYERLPRVNRSLEKALQMSCLSWINKVTQTAIYMCVCGSWYRHSLACNVNVCLREILYYTILTTAFSSALSFSRCLPHCFLIPRYSHLTSYTQNYTFWFKTSTTLHLPAKTKGEE